MFFLFLFLDSFSVFFCHPYVHLQCKSLWKKSLIRKNSEMSEIKCHKGQRKRDRDKGKSLVKPWNRANQRLHVPVWSHFNNHLEGSPNHCIPLAYDWCLTIINNQSTNLLYGVTTYPRLSPLCISPPSLSVATRI